MKKPTTNNIQNAATNYQTLTIQEVCDLLKLNRHTVYELIYSGQLKAYRFGKSYRVLADDLQSLFANNKAA